MFTLRPALRYLLIVCAVFLLGGALFMLIYSSKVLVDFNDVRRFVVTKCTTFGYRTSLFYKYSRPSWALYFNVSFGYETSYLFGQLNYGTYSSDYSARQSASQIEIGSTVNCYYLPEEVHPNNSTNQLVSRLPADPDELYAQYVGLAIGGSVCLAGFVAATVLLSLHCHKVFKVAQRKSKTTFSQAATNKEPC